MIKTGKILDLCVDRQKQVNRLTNLRNKIKSDNGKCYEEKVGHYDQDGRVEYSK